MPKCRPRRAAWLAAGDKGAKRVVVDDERKERAEEWIRAEMTPGSVQSLFLASGASDVAIAIDRPTTIWVRHDETVTTGGQAVSVRVSLRELWS
jgi:hypothetical protein